MAFAQNPLPVWPEPGPEPPQPVLSRRSENLLLALVGVGIVAVTIALIEVSLSAAHVAAPEDAALGPLHRYSEVYGWKPRKGFRMVEAGRVTTINEQGYRGSLLPPQKSGARRVVFLGDSIVFGLEVSDDQTFSEVLHARRRDIEVANLAVQGYDPGQELIKLEREGLALRPDVVVLGLCVDNDFADVALPVFLYDGMHPKPYFLVENGQLVERDRQLKLSLRQRLALFLSEHSRIYLALSRNWHISASAPEHWSDRRERALQDREGVTDLTARLIARMDDDCRRAGAVLIVLAFPDKKTYKGDSSWLNDLMASTFMRDVAVIDMAGRYRAQNLRFSDFAFDKIGHLSPQGHRLTAEILEDVLVERGVLPTRPDGSS